MRRQSTVKFQETPTPINGNVTFGSSFKSPQKHTMGGTKPSLSDLRESQGENSSQISLSHTFMNQSQNFSNTMTQQQEYQSQQLKMIREKKAKEQE